MRPFQALALGMLLLTSRVPAQEDWRASRTPQDLPFTTRALLAEAPRGSADDKLRSALTALSTASFSTLYQKAEAARALADGAAFYAARDVAFAGSLSRAAEANLAEFAPWLADFGKQVDAWGGFKEPAWIHAQPEALAQAVLAWCSLEKVATDPARRDRIAKFAQGIMLCLRKEPNKYPFRAHVSLQAARPDVPDYVPVPGGGQASGALWIPSQSRQVEALCEAAHLTGDPALTESACMEGLDVWAHLAISDKLPYAFAPRPVGSGTALASEAVVGNLMSLFRATHSPVYAQLAGLAARYSAAHPGRGAAEQAAAALIESEIKNSPALLYSKSSDVTAPLSYQVMEAEDGKAVKKDFDVFDVTYPGGTPGKVARVGGGDMFWMRFDVDREDDYDFYLIFLKSQLEGGLVSIMMRIDGDKIFQVPFGGASEAYMDMAFVDGPRSLRQGPHSFGIRFSGLLMTQPAILDSVIAWPTVERRYVQLPDGRQALLLHNHSPAAARTSYAEIESWPPSQISALDGTGAAAKLERQSDKRRHKEYLLVPPAGAAVLEWTGKKEK